MGKKTGLSVAERREAVLSLIRREEPVAVISRRYGVSNASLYRWRDDFLLGGDAALKNGHDKADAKDRKIKDLEAALAEREQVIGEITIANRILKKRVDH